MPASNDDVFLLNRMNSTARKVGLGDLVNIQSYDSTALSGGSGATRTLTVTGLAVGDTVLAVTPRVAGANAASVRAFGSPSANSLSVTFTADPGDAAVVRVLVLKAVSQ
jgi:hypothetical protein